MSTFMAKKDVEGRKWYVLDAAGKPLGKTAVAAADILRGKVKPEFTPMLTAVTSSSLSTLRRLC
jgi:large subunit ribosomal protein L13